MTGKSFGVVHQLQSQAHVVVYLEQHRRPDYRQGQHSQHRYEWPHRWQLHRDCPRVGSQDEEGRGSELQLELHGEGTAEESADDVLLGESDGVAGWRKRDDYL